MGLETGLCVAVLVDLAARVIRSGQLGLLRSWDGALSQLGKLSRADFSSSAVRSRTRLSLLPPAAAFDVVSCLPFLVTTYLPIAALFPACEGYLPVRWWIPENHCRCCLTARLGRWALKSI